VIVFKYIAERLQCPRDTRAMCQGAVVAEVAHLAVIWNAHGSKDMSGRSCSAQSIGDGVAAARVC
jgi:hypothetical protein